MGERNDFQVMITELKETYSFDLTALALVQPDHHFMLKWVFIAGNKHNQYNRIMLKAEKGIAGTVFKTGKVLKMPDVDAAIAPDEIYQYPIVQFEDIKSLIAIPLFQYHRVEAVLLVASRKPGEVTEETYQLLMAEIGDRFGPFYTEEMTINVGKEENRSSRFID
ncbi:GAF domain-containing protein [Gracilibacillus sp. S3-1-1]|uniref:GAF domain-containing protein n=1 Tax=Gracilibacillus pellucidus TaxID=3095368 RepID=A0ACC6M4J9_9BACI|nr:GAF domain-containing protein [Gracilibacillus sp. S3-1-1]MDX8045841.1 GAF domain-containing protein [Gracilibacillus sp. S3-1-1]